MSRDVSRIYVGNLPPDATHRDLEDLFAKFGHIVDITVKRNRGRSPDDRCFGFVEFEDPRDARDAIHERDGYEFQGGRLRVEIPNGPRGGRRMGGEDEQRGQRPTVSRGSGMRRYQWRLLVSGLPRSGSWQDLKDHMRGAGDIVFADVAQSRDGTGVVEFSSRDDMENALRKYDGSRFRSHEGEESRITLVPENEYGSRYRSRSRSPRSRSPYRSPVRTGSPGRSPVRSRSFSRSRSPRRYRDR